MAGIITEKRKEELEDIRIQLEELAIYIQRVIDGRSSLADITRIYNIPPQKLNNDLNSGTFAVLKRLQILNSVDIENLLRDSKSPAERLISCILDTNELIILSIVEEDKLIEVMEKALTEKEFQVIKYRYGFYDGTPKTQQYVSEIFGNTKERIGQIEAKALRKLREPKYLRMLLPNYDLYIKELKENETMERLSTEMENRISLNDKYGNIPVTDLDISIRARNCLIRGGIRYINKLLDTPINDLLKIRNCGSGCIKEINAALEKQFGVSLTK